MKSTGKSNFDAIVISSSNTRSRIDNIMNTWGREVDGYIFSDEQTDDTIKVSDNPEYDSHIEKTFNAFEWCLKNSKKGWFLLVGDDNFINNSAASIRCYMNKGFAIGRKINCYKPDRELKYLSGGAGIMMGKYVIDVINKYRDYEINKHKWCDVIIGNILKNLNIHISNDFSFHPLHYKNYKYCEEEIRNAATFHYITEREDMQYLYDLCY